jgi:cell division inhibitor SepF
MSALYRLKAYFGMVPAEELDDYAYGEADRDLPSDDYDYEPAYERGRRGAQSNPHAADWQSERRAGRSRWNDDDGSDYKADYKADYKNDYKADYQEDDYQGDGYYDEPEPAAPGRGRRGSNPRGWTAETPVRGALAVDPSREAHREAYDVPVRTRQPPAEEAHPLARITTLHPRTYSEARTIGEHYRDGIPVIMNLTGMADADARRLVDFAAGLAFALRGSMDKITTKVFLISPPNVDVTAEDRRRLAEGGFLNRSQ